jgi:hypothetical protein
MMKAAQMKQNRLLTMKPAPLKQQKDQIQE